MQIRNWPKFVNTTYRNIIRISHVCGAFCSNLVPSEDVTEDSTRSKLLHIFNSVSCYYVKMSVFNNLFISKYVFHFRSVILVVSEYKINSKKKKD